MNGDKPGRDATAKYVEAIKGEYGSIKITNVEVPQDEDVNSLLQGHSPEILTHLIKTRKEYDFLFSIEKEAVRTETTEIPIEPEPTEKVSPQEPVKTRQTIGQAGLDTSNPYNLKYATATAKYQIKGFRLSQPDSLKITLNITRR